jgi:hypothetical protein
MNVLSVGIISGIIISGISISLLLFRTGLQQDADQAPAPAPNFASIDMAINGLEPQAPEREPARQGKIERSMNDAEELAVSINEPMDPSEELFFATSSPTATLEIGEPLDPDDLNQFEAVYAPDINVGEPTEPEQPSPWIESGAEMVIGAGEAGEPTEDWPPFLNESQAPIGVGEPLDIDDMSTIFERL